MKIVDILKDEKESLRAELQHLKLCQLRYFSLSITVTGVIFGIASRVKVGDDLSAVSLAPLVVLIPCWLIFFDKAKTISRIVGYYRVLEETHISMVLESKNETQTKTKYCYIGWENALSEKRKATLNKAEVEAEAKTNIKKVVAEAIKNTKALFKMERLAELVFLRTSHKYWVINWYTYLVLSVISLTANIDQYSKIKDGVSCLSFMATVLSIIVIGVVAFTTLKALLELIYGVYSYDSNEEDWRDLLVRKKGR